MQVKFEFVDMLGSPYTQAKSIKVSLIGPSPSSSVIDASAQAKTEKNVVTLKPNEADVKPGKYQVLF